MSLKVMCSKKECKAFGLAVKHKLLEVEMTQKELSEITGINLQYIYFITNGIRPGIKHREKIRAVLGMPSVKESINNYLKMAETEQ